MKNEVRSLYRTFGPPKSMGVDPIDNAHPLFFLVRQFLDEVDLAILFNTKRCRYQCRFCALPAQSSRRWIEEDKVLAQFLYVINEAKHTLGVLDRLTIANEGSVLDFDTFPRGALEKIISAAEEILGIKKIVLEIRMEFVKNEVLEDLSDRTRRKLAVLTGFETLDSEIRSAILGRSQDVSLFEAGIEILARNNTDLIAYVLYKPHQLMTDAEARVEASNTIDFLAIACERNGINLTIRLNPMYAAKGTPWYIEAMAAGDKYSPPLLSDVIELADEKRARGIPVYIGLTSEGRAPDNATYKARPEHKKDFLKKAIAMNMFSGSPNISLES